MSYDLLVFDPSSAPRARDAFLAWYDGQTAWTEDHGYNDPAVSTPQLRSWFLEMIGQFPAMNGPHATDDVDDPRVTDYSVGRFVIYAAFAWSEADDARRIVRALAEKHGIGFFEASADVGELRFPGD